MKVIFNYQDYQEQVTSDIERKILERDEFSQGFLFVKTIGNFNVYRGTNDISGKPVLKFVHYDDHFNCIMIQFDNIIEMFYFIDCTTNFQK